MQWGYRPAEAPADLNQSRSRPVQIHATLVDERGEREGTITDLSAAGCAVETMPPLLEHAILGIRLNALDDNPPLVVEAAIVRSSLGSRAELEFLRVAPKEEERLNEFILSLWIEGTQIARSSGRWKTSPLPGL
jgi:c-di-GMP-binding flagellar brake protein YcgR